MNRTCAYGIFVARYIESLPKFVGWINEYDLDGNRRFLVCAAGSRTFETAELQREMLRIAYGWARMRTRLEAASMEGVDPAMILSKLQLAKDSLKNLTAIKRQCTTIMEAAEEIERIGDQVMEKLNEQIRAIEAELHKGTA